MFLQELVDRRMGSRLHVPINVFRAAAPPFWQFVFIVSVVVADVSPNSKCCFVCELNQASAADSPASLRAGVSCGFGGNALSQFSVGGSKVQELQARLFKLLGIPSFCLQSR